MTDTAVLPSLDEIEDPRSDLIGSKAANLVRAVAHGFRVPAGLVVTATALNTLGDDLDAALDTAVDRIGAAPSLSGRLLWRRIWRMRPMRASTKPC
ncbi:hypothetical protein ACQ86L_0245 (plasmid) [Leifsonia sp. P73]